MKLLLAVALCLAAALAAACGNPASAPTPTPTHAPTPTPGPPVGPIVLIAAQPPYVVSSPPTSQPPPTLIAYDAGAHHEYRRLALPPGAGTPVFRAAMRDVLYVSGADGASQLHAWDPMTGADRILAARAAAPMISPDGRMAAYTTIEDGTPSTVADIILVDLTTGSQRTLFHSGDAERSALHGYPSIMVWRDDGQALLVEGARGGPPGTWATLLLDGTLVPSIIGYAVAAPSGRALYTDGSNDVGCILSPTQRLRIFDAATGAVTAEVDDPGRGIVPRAWSPSGDALLYEQYRTTPRPDGIDCVAEYEVSSGAWYLLPTSGGPPQPVADVDALRRSWHDGLTITYTCTTHDPPRVFDDCSREPTSVSVDGRPVATGSPVTLLGIVDVQGG